jgi:hypothetical protein
MSVLKVVHVFDFVIWYLSVLLWFMSCILVSVTVNTYTTTNFEQYRCLLLYYISTSFEFNGSLSGSIHLKVIPL